MRIEPDTSMSLAYRAGWVPSPRCVGVGYRDTGAAKVTAVSSADELPEVVEVVVTRARHPVVLEHERCDPQIIGRDGVPCCRSWPNGEAYVVEASTRIRCASIIDLTPIRSLLRR